MKQRYEHKRVSFGKSGPDLALEEDGWELCAVTTTWFNTWEHCGQAFWKRPVGDWARGFDERPEPEGKGDFS